MIIKAIFSAVASSPRYLRPSAWISLMHRISQVEGPTKVLSLIAFYSISLSLMSVSQCVVLTTHVFS